MASIDAYRASLRSAIRGLWSNKLSQSSFKEAMQSAINRGLTQAWLIGGKDCSTSINDLTTEERAKLALFIVEQVSFVQRFSDEIVLNDKDHGGALQPLIARADMWANKWNEVRQTAEAMCAGNKKKVWILGATELHCFSCNGLKGRIYRLNTWMANNALPPTHATACRGFRCRCFLQDTAEPITKGKFPVSLLAR